MRGLRTSKKTEKRVVQVCKTGPGETLESVFPGHDTPLPEVGEEVIVHAVFANEEFDGVVVGRDDELHTYNVKVKEELS